MRAPKTIHWSGAAVALCAALTTGCADIDYRPATTHNEVVNITEKQVLSGQRVKLRQKGRALSVFVSKVCDTVEDREMARISVRKSDEDVTVEAVLMSLATVPIGVGIALLVDSQNVYDNDVNGRLYNSSGQGGAQAAGAVSLVLGTGLLVGSMVSLIRRAKPKTDESTFHEDGDVLEAHRPCTGNLRTTSVQVMGMLDSGVQVSLGVTNQFGELHVDLVHSVGASHFATVSPPLSMQVRVGNDSYGLVDLETVAAHHERTRDNAWANADVERCGLELTQAACSGVSEFLRLFPNGRHSVEANDLVTNIGKPHAAKAKGGNGKVQHVAGATCAQKCLVKCEQDQRCAAGCVQQVCK